MADVKGNYRHGYYGTPTYSTWANMKYRCGRKNNRNNYEKISYCERWEKFENFLEDMGIRPDGTTLDRIDPYGNYEPSNCRWADITTQENNRTNNKKYLFEGEMLTLNQIAKRANISRSNLANKIYIYKMSMDEAVKLLKGEMTYR
jgi:hypothetical protein